MTNPRTIQPDARTVIVGVDTHKHVHVAVAIDTWGIRLDDRSCAADSDGYQPLITWAERHGRVAAFGIEGTGSYGAGLARAVRRAGHQVLEVNRGDRRTRRIAGTSDPVDAETAAVGPGGPIDRHPEDRGRGAVEMMRHLKVARRTAVNARTSAMITLKQIVVPAPPARRETRHPLADQALLTRGRGWRCGTIDTPTASAKQTLRALARRWFALSVEIVDHDRHRGRLTTQTSPTLREGLGIGADTAAEMLIICGDTPDRIHAEAACATLCGACPIPASSGMTTGRHRLYRGGHRQANAALHRAVIVRMRSHSPTLNSVERRTAEGRPTREILRCLKRLSRPRDLSARRCRGRRRSPRSGLERVGTRAEPHHLRGGDSAAQSAPVVGRWLLGGSRRRPRPPRLLRGLPDWHSARGRRRIQPVPRIRDDQQRRGQRAGLCARDRSHPPGPLHARRRLGTARPRAGDAALSQRRRLWLRDPRADVHGPGLDDPPGPRADLHPADARRRRVPRRRTVPPHDAGHHARRVDRRHAAARVSSVQLHLRGRRR